LRALIQKPIKSLEITVKPSFRQSYKHAARLACWLILLALPMTASLADDSLGCGYCGKKIVGRYVEYEDRYYHQDCYNEHVAPKCGICGKTLEGEWVVYENQNYHQKCYTDDVALKCSVCGGIIEGEYLVDHWGNKYHKYHEDEIPSCSFCGRLFSDPLAGRGISLDRTHHICAACREQAVNDEALGRRLLDEARARLARAGVIIKQDDIGFELVTAERLSKLMDRDSENHFGLTHYKHTRYLAFLEDREYTIYVRQGLPRLHFISTAAHELMHVWLFRNTHQETEKPLLEGSCNYAAVLVLRQYNDDMAGYVIKQMDEEPDLIYGDGFRRVKKMADNHGVEHWLQHLRLDPEFPIGY
jgi:hypothetical protein